MKVYFWVTVQRCSAKSEVFAQLLRLCPDGFHQTESAFRCEFPLPDGRADQVLAILRNAGLKTWKKLASREEDEFELIYRREYDERDWEAAEWLQARTYRDFEQVYAERGSDGRLQMEPRFFKRPIILDGSGADSLIVSKQVRTWLEEGGLRGMVFRPTAKVKGRGAADESNLWELTTEVVLPRMSSRMTFLDAQGHPTQAGQEGGFSLVEGFFIPVEYHYTRSALARVRDTDLALTWEHFGMPDSHYPEILVSKRFYEVCCAHGLKMDWIPVRIDPD